MSKSLKPVIIFFAISFLIFLYLFLALLHSNRVNNKFDSNKRGDQLAHIQAIKRISNENFRYLGDRNRMPLYDQFQALFYTQGMEDKVLFTQAKIVNIILSVVLIFLIFLIISKYLAPFSNVALTLIFSFTLFLPKVAYIQPELLYYALSFITFIFMCRAIKFLEWKDGIIVGSLSAFAYLTKATAYLPFVIFLAFQGVYFLTLISKSLYNLKKRNRQLIIQTKKIIATTILSTLVFILILSPYLADNKKIFGKYFFNYNTNYYILYDSWEEFLEDNKEESPDFWLNRPKNEAPSFKKYIQEHSLKDIAKKEFVGILLQISFILKENYSQLSASFLYFYLLFLVFNIIKNPKNSKYLLKFLKKNKILLSFIMLYFSLQFLAFSWYSVIAQGPRLTFSLFLPLAFGVFYLADRFSYPEVFLTSKLKVSLLNLFHISSLIMLVLIFKPFLIPFITDYWGGS